MLWPESPVPVEVKIYTTCPYLSVCLSSPPSLYPCFGSSRRTGYSSMTSGKLHRVLPDVHSFWPQGNGAYLRERPQALLLCRWAHYYFFRRLLVPAGQSCLQSLPGILYSLCAGFISAQLYSALAEHAEFYLMTWRESQDFCSVLDILV